MEQSTALVLALVCLAVVAFRCLFLRRQSLSYILGPPSSWLYGNNTTFSYQENVGDLDFRYLQEYGSVWRMALPLGISTLVLADPKALQHVIAKGGYDYERRADNRIGNELIMGRGVAWATGEAHTRHRRILAPAFTPSQLRLFATLFRASAAKLSQKWKEEVLQDSETGQDIVINKWLARITLDIIGETAFDYDFGALENKDNKVSNAYHNMFSESIMHPRTWDILFKATWKWFPISLLSYVKYIPTREYARFRRTLNIIEGVSRKLVEEKKEAYISSEEKSKDIMSILVQANVSSDSSTRLSDVEVVAQMATLTLAGHETTANTLTWALWEVSKTLDFQEKIRTEIATVRGKVAERGGGDFTIEDLESMQFTNALLKETLRYHPAVYHLTRVAQHDDIIPLAYPIQSKAGETISQIPVSKGQDFLIDICAYNRLPQVWGEDAHLFNPMRWICSTEEKDTKVGIYANLMTFSAGVRSCIGWRFSVIESLALLVELLENFRFSLPLEKAEIIRLPTGIMTPMVKGKEREGVQMPLHVMPVREL